MHPDTDLNDEAAVIIEYALDRKHISDTDEIRAYSQEILNKLSNVFRWSPLLRKVAAELIAQSANSMLAHRG